MKRPSFWFLPALLLAGAPLHAETVELKFEDLPGLVASQNQAVKGANALVESAEKRTGHFARSYYPHLRLAVGGESFETGDYRARSEPYGEAEARINLFRGGRDRLEERIRRARTEAASASAQKAYRDELHKARAIFWDLAFNREMIQVLTEAAEENRKILASANRRIKQGLVTPTDRLEFEIHGTELKEEIESLKHGVVLLEAALAPLVGKPAGTAFHASSAIPHHHDESLLAAAVAAHPEVQSLRTSLAAANLQRTEAARWWTPSLDLYGGKYLYTLRERDYADREDRDDAAAGVRLSLYLFDGWESRADARAHERQARGLDAQARYREAAVQAELFIAKEDLKHDHELILFSEEKIRQARQHLARSLDEYDRGVKNSLEVLSAQQRTLSFRRQYAQRRRDYQRTHAHLLKILGR